MLQGRCENTRRSHHTPDNHLNNDGHTYHVWVIYKVDKEKIFNEDVIVGNYSYIKKQVSVDGEHLPKVQLYLPAPRVLIVTSPSMLLVKLFALMGEPMESISLYHCAYIKLVLTHVPTPRI